MVRLPAEYQEVEYLESSGTQYIKTNIESRFSIEYESDIMFTAAQDSYSVGCIDSNHRICGNGFYRSYFQIGYGNNYRDVNVGGLNENTLYRLKTVLTPGEQKVYVNGVLKGTVSIPKPSVTLTGKHISIFGRLKDDNEFGQACKARLYSLTVSDGDLILGNFIPCYRKSDSEPGMYDTVTKQFFTNQGTGTFIVGNDVSWDTASLIERRRQILLNTPHIETISGSIASFETDVPALVKDCKVYFTPVQEGTGDPSPDNVRPISGWTGIEFYNSSPNIFPLHPPATAFRGQFSTGDTTISSASIMKCWTIYVGKNKKLTYQRKATGTSCNLAFCDTPLTSRTGAVIYNALNMTNRSNQYINSGEHPYLVMCATDASYAPGSGYDIKELMLSFGTTVKPYAPRVDNNLIIPDWESEVGEVYGGYVDLVKGEVVEEYQKFVLDGINRWLTAGIKTSDSRGGIYVNYVEAYNYFTDGGLSGMIKPNSLVSQWDWKSNRFSVSNSDPGDYAMLQLAGGHNPYIRLFVHKSQLGDISDRSHITDSMKAWLSDNPIEISYKPITPITHQLTPQVIKTLKGINNIWSDANGNIELRFWKH